jgi:aspartate aminotransferase
MAGWRAGYFAAPPTVVKAIGNLQSHTASNASNLVQYAALAALGHDNDSFVKHIRELLTGQRTVALSLIKAIPQVSCVIPSGAFYLFPNVSGIINKSFEGRRIENVDMLAEVLLEHAHIAVVPGSAFGSNSHIRISYAIPTAEITRGLQSFERFVGALD